jgi:CRISPR/Cas system-associated exonuclease Cas4 (RecB family)
MTNIAEIMETSIQRVDDSYEKKNVVRTRLGLSQCGHKCPRYLWLCHHGYTGEQPDGRVLRLFQLGNVLEDQTKADLLSAGFNIHSGQAPVEFTMDGITLTGSIDGIIEGLVEAPKTPHLWEHKTCSKKKYNELIKKGSYRAWNEGYYWQVQAYMLGLKLTRAAVFVYCKDDSTLYMERIPLDKEATINKLQDVFTAIRGDMPEGTCPPGRLDFWERKFCNFGEVCGW